VQTSQEDAVGPLDGVGDHFPGHQLLGQCLLYRLGRNDEEVDRQPDEFVSRQAAMAVVCGLLQCEGDAGAQTLRGFFGQSEPHGDGVGGAEADAADVTRQAIGILGHHLDGVVAVGLEDPHGARGSHAVRMQEHHDVAHGLLLGPAGGDLRHAHLPDAGHLAQPDGFRLDDFEGRLAEGSDDALGELGTDAAHQAGAEIFLDSLRRRRRRGLEEVRLELRPVSTIGDPDADGMDELAC